MRFKALDSKQRDRTVAFTFDGVPLKAVPGQTVAAALLESGIVAFQKNRGQDESRGPYCLMGTCFECLVQIDDTGTCQACLTPVSQDMRITSG